MIRVIYLVTTNAIGGAENNLLRVLSAMGGQGLQAAGVLVPRPGPLADSIRVLNVPVGFVSYHAFRWRNPLRYLHTLGSLRHWVDSTRADVVHLNHQWLVEFAVQVGRLTRRPVVCHIRNLLGPDQLTPLLPWLLKVEAVVGVSQAVLEPLVAAGLPESRIHLIHNGVDLARLQRVNRPTVLHKDLGLLDSTRLIGVLGRVVPEKGIGEFIAAAKVISTKLSDLHFVIVGEDDEQGRYIQRLRRRLQQSSMCGLVTLTGFRSDIADILHDLDLVVLPSRSDMPEGLPNSVLEALAVGRLVVATRNSGIPEVVHDGINGFLVDCGDSDALAAAIERALALPEAMRCEMEAMARESVKDRTIENQIGKLAELYRSLAVNDRNGGEHETGVLG